MNPVVQSLLAKAAAYVERGLETDDEAVRAWWFHFAVEPLLRAGVATLHPAVLADPHSIDSLLAAASSTTEGAELSRSRPANQLLEIARRLDGFDADVKDAAAKLLLRRNAECHGIHAVFEDLDEGAWMPDFLLLATAVCRATSTELSSLVGDGYAEYASTLSAETAGKAEAEVARLIAAARDRPQLETSAPPWNLREYAGGRVEWVESCPACKSTGTLRGRRVYVGQPRLDEIELVREATVTAYLFECPACQLSLDHALLISAAGLKVSRRITDHVDPYEQLGIDPIDEAEARGLHVVDPHDYAYQDE